MPLDLQNLSSTDRSDDKLFSEEGIALHVPRCVDDDVVRWGWGLATTVTTAEGLPRASKPTHEMIIYMCIYIYIYKYIYIYHFIYAYIYIQRRANSFWEMLGHS